MHRTGKLLLISTSLIGFNDWLLCRYALNTIRMSS
jgi:hypothetical protein